MDSDDSEVALDRLALEHWRTLMRHRFMNGHCAVALSPTSQVTPPDSPTSVVSEAADPGIDEFIAAVDAATNQTQRRTNECTAAHVPAVQADTVGPAEPVVTAVVTCGSNGSTGAPVGQAVVQEQAVLQVPSHPAIAPNTRLQKHRSGAKKAIVRKHRIKPQSSGIVGSIC